MAIPAFFIRYDEEHKGWKFTSYHNNPPIFWSNAATFFKDKLWQDHTDTIQVQGMGPLHYNKSSDIEDLGYAEEDIHDEPHPQLIAHIDKSIKGQDMDPKQDCASLNDTLSDKEGDRIDTAQETYPWLHLVMVAESF
ncbi:hypothetical protein NDA11_007479 [Ustilago hordei]|nr:hypothetical protein NDA11_007479 [Ustilago hordei]